MNTNLKNNLTIKKELKFNKNGKFKILMMSDIQETLAYDKRTLDGMNKLIEKEKTIAVQVNGKVRATITINVDDSEDIVKEKALEQDNVKRFTEGKEIVKIIVIKGKIVNIVVK